MQSAEWLKIKEVFGNVLELPTSERAEILNQQENDVRVAVEKLLKSYDDSEKFIAEPAVV